MKKSLSVAMVVAMVSSMFASMAFADDAATTTTTSTPTTAQEKFDALVKAGIFDADGTGNGADLNGLTTRAQIAKIIAKVYNLSDDAASASTFKDLDGSGWAAGVIGAVAKAKLMEGRADGVFAPTANVKLEELAIILARAFKLDTTASTDVGNGNVDDWAKGAVAATLKAGLIPASTDFTKEAIRSDLATSAFAAVAKVKADADAVEAAKIKVSSVSSIDNNRTLVTFSGDASAVVASSFAVKDAAGKDVAVNSIAVRGDKKSVFVNTADMTAGSSYSISFNSGDATTFVAKPADASKPALGTVAAVTNNLVRVVFDNTDIDLDTVAVAANYTVDNNLTVNSVALDTDYNKANTTKTAVLLSTSAQTTGTIYTVTVKNVADLAGNVVDSTVTKKFAGVVADATAPAISSVLSYDGNTVEVTFTEPSMLDVTAATNAANYTIAGLTVNKAEIKAGTNVLGGNPVVVLSTSNQTVGNLYTVSISNVKDSFGNVSSSALTKNFGGTALDTSALNLSTVTADSNTIVRVKFDDKTDKDTALNIANYTLDGGLKVSAAAYDKDGNGNDVTDTVLLTTDAQTVGALYTLTIANIKDDAGNGVGTTNSKKFAGVAADVSAPTVSSFTVLAGGDLQVVYDAKVDTASATNVLNYKIDGGLGYAVSASLAGDGKTVTLKTAAQTAGTLYTLSILGVKDVAGNAITTAITKQFPGTAATANVQVSGAVAIDKNTVKIMFNQPVAALTAGDLTFINLSKAAGSLGTADLTKVNGNDTTSANLKPLGGAGEVATTDVTITWNSTNTEATVIFNPTQASVAGNLYQVNVATTVTGKYGASFDTTANTAQFGGVSTARKVSLQVATPVDPTHVDLKFNASLDSTTLAGFTTGDVALYADGSSTALNATAATLLSDTTVVRLTVPTLANNTVYNVNIASNTNLKDASKFYPVSKDDTANVWEASFATPAFGTLSLNPQIAVQKESNKIDVTFDKLINTAAGFTASNIKVLTDDGSTAVSGLHVTDAVVDGSTLHIYTDKDLSGSNSNVYYVDLTATGVIDKIVDKFNTGVALNTTTTTKTSLPTAKSIVDNNTPAVSSVVATAVDKVKVTFNESIMGTASAADFYVKDANGVVYTTNVSYDDSGYLGTKATTHSTTVYLQAVGAKFNQGKTYTVVLPTTNDMTDLASHVVKGSSDLTFNFSGLNVASGTAVVAAPAKSATSGLSSVAGATPGTTVDVVAGSTDAGTLPANAFVIEYKFAATGTTLTASDTANGNSGTYVTTIGTGAVVLDELTPGAGNVVFVRFVDAAGNKSAWTEL